MNRSHDDIARQKKAEQDFERNILANAAAQLLEGKEPDWQNWKDYCNPYEPTPAPDMNTLFNKIDNQFATWFGPDEKFSEYHLFLYRFIVVEYNLF